MSEEIKYYNQCRLRRFLLYHLRIWTYSWMYDCRWISSPLQISYSLMIKHFPSGFAFHIFFWGYENNNIIMSLSIYFWKDNKTDIVNKRNRKSSFSNLLQYNLLCDIMYMFDDWYECVWWLINDGKKTELFNEWMWKRYTEMYNVTNPGKKVHIYEEIWYFCVINFVCALKILFKNRTMLFNILKRKKKSWFSFFLSFNGYWF